MTEAAVMENLVDTLPGMDDQLFASVQEPGGTGLLAQKREQAFAAYQSIRAPVRTDEEWRRTDPTLFPIGEMNRLPTLQPVEQLPEHPWDEAFDVVVAVQANGYAIRHRNETARDLGISVLSLADAAVQKPELVEEYLHGNAMQDAAGKYEALNDAFWNFGLLIHIPERVVWEKGMLIRYAMTENQSLLIPRVVVVAGQGSRAVVTERMESPDSVHFMAVSTRELYVDEAANLKWISLQEWGLNSYQVSNDWGIAQRDASLNWITLNFGSARSKMKFGGNMAGPGSAADMDGIFFCTGEQHMDQRTLQIHASPDTYSRLLYKGAVKDTGRSVYQGLIIAKPGAIRVDAYQTNNNLVLDDGARADSIPGLLIDADDLKCSHGSTIGNLDAEQLFYLRTRGLSEEQARRVLVRGFFVEIVDRIPQEFIRDTVYELIEKKMEPSDHETT